MQPEPNSFQTGLSDEAMHILKTQLVDLVEPLNDHQLLDLADGIHEMLRQRRAVRQHHVERMKDKAGHAVNLLI